MKGDNLSVGRSVRQWHSWQDKPGMPCTPMYHRSGKFFSYNDAPIYSASSAEQLLETIGGNQLYVLCNDILNTKELPYINDLLGWKGVSPYISRTGGIPAMALRSKRRTGFLIPTSTWKWNEPEPDRHLIDNLATIFKVTGFQAATPASLSEKILRSTLSVDMRISRPSSRLRADILANNVGGRIDRAVMGTYYPTAIEYDKNKAYPYHSRLVPSPFEAPVSRVKPTVEEALSEYPTGWWECEMIGRYHRIPPIQIDGRSVQDGECFSRWLWTGELQDCIRAGYTVGGIRRGYGFRTMSDFMLTWSDILWNLLYLSECDNDHIRAVVKSMMVGLPGRFLRQPETYTLIPFSEIRKERHDFALLYHGGDTVVSDWGVHPEYAPESTALSAVGSYIVSEMRQELYHTMQAIEQHGGYVISSYIDCIRCVGAERYMDSLIGQGLGEWKKKKFVDVYAEENRFLGVEVDPYGWPEDERVQVRAPGYGIEQRIALLQKYQSNFNIRTLVP